MQDSPAGYAAGMMQHLQDVEDWQKQMREVDDEGWGVCQQWVMIHKDGRVANLPDCCPYEELKVKSAARQRAWLLYMMRRSGVLC